MTYSLDPDAKRRGILLINELVLKVEYQYFKSDEPFSLTFHPYFLKQYNNRWFVFGLNEEFEVPTWNLALYRIKSISQTQKTYKPTDIDRTEYFFDIIGMTKKKDAELKEVKLEFLKQLAPYITTKPIHPTQKSEYKNGKLVVSIQLIPNYELVSQILSYGDQVKVIAPEGLKLEVKKKIQNSLEND